MPFLEFSIRPWSTSWHLLVAKSLSFSFEWWENELYRLRAYDSTASLPRKKKKFNSLRALGERNLDATCAIWASKCSPWSTETKFAGIRIPWALAASRRSSTTFTHARLKRCSGSSSNPYFIQLYLYSRICNVILIIVTEFKCAPLIHPIVSLTCFARKSFGCFRYVHYCWDNSNWSNLI